MKRSLVFVYAAFCLRYVYPLVLVPFFARTLGVGEYGRVLAANSLAMLVWVAVDYGFPSCGARDTAGATSPKQLAEIYGRHLAGRLAMFLPGIMIGVVGTLTSPVLRERPIFGVLATVGGLLSGLNLGWYFQGNQRFVTSVVLEVLGTVINLPLMLWLVRGDGVAVLWVNTVSSALLSAIAHGVALRTLDLNAVKVRGAISLVREATSLFAHRGFGMLVQSGAIYIISLFMDAHAIGAYGSAEKLVGLGLSAMTPAGQILISTISKRLSEGASDVYALMQKALLGMLVVSVVGCVAVYSLSGIMVPIALGPGFDEAIPIVKVLIFLLPFAGMNQAMGGYVLIPIRADKVVSTSSLLNLFVAVPLMCLLVTRFGLLGVAAARVVSEAMVTIFLTVILQRKQLWAKIFAWKGTTPDVATQDL